MLHRKQTCPSISSALIRGVLVAGLILFIGCGDGGAALDSGNPDHRAIAVAIRAAIEKPEGELTDADFQKVKALSLLPDAGKEVKDISPLAKLTGLESLNLSGNKVEDIDSLSGLSSLKALILVGNSVKPGDLTYLDTDYTVVSTTNSLSFPELGW